MHPFEDPKKGPKPGPGRRLNSELLWAGGVLGLRCFVGALKAYGQLWGLGLALLGSLGFSVQGI